MKRIYRYSIVLLALFLACGEAIYAQQDGYSQTYVYRGDTLRRSDYTGTNFIYNPTTGGIIFPYYSAKPQYRFLNQWLSLDAEGNILREATEEIPNTTYFTYAIAYAYNSENEFYAGGGYQVYGDTFSTLFLQKKDTQLNTVWRKEYSIPFYGHIWHIIPLDEESLILQAVVYRDSINAQYPASHSKVDLIKTDTAGNLIWHRAVDSTEWNIVHNIIKAHDGNLILCGRTWGYGVTDGAGFVMKVDTAGNKLWHRVYELPGYDGFEKIIATADGNYICAGWTAIAPEISDMPNGAGRVMKLNEQGEPLWDRIINISPRDDWFRTVVEATNGDVVAFGGTYKYYAYDFYAYELGSTRGPEGWALRLDANGNEVWSRVFGHNAIEDCHDYLYNAMALPDGSFIATGSTSIRDTFYNDGAHQAYRRQAAWVVKLNSDGCLNIDCPGSLGTGVEHNAKVQVGLYPNPGNGLATILSSESIPAGASLYITDVVGRSIQSQRLSSSGKEILIDLQSKPEGIYFIRLKAGKMVYSFKYVKVDGR